MAADHVLDTPLGLREQAAPATPAAGIVKVYADADGDLAVKDDAGVVQNFGKYAKAIVVHGADNTVARPTGFASVEWQGSVLPDNMTAADTWVDTS